MEEQGSGPPRSVPKRRGVRQTRGQDGSGLGRGLKTYAHTKSCLLCFFLFRRSVCFESFLN